MRNRLYTFLAILIGFVVAGAMAEIFVRLFVEETIAPRFAVDTGYGVRGNEPNNRYRQSVPGEYSVMISVNSHGMRGLEEYPISKPKGTKRVLMLGDSFVYGVGVEDDEVVSAVLEGLLNSQADIDGRWGVINLGVSGFGQAEELVTFRNRGRLYEPDYVVLFYFDNDPGNNAVSSLFVVDESGNLLRTETEYLPAVRTREVLFSIPPIRWLFMHSQAWNLIRNRLSFLIQKSKLKEAGLKSFSSVSAGTTDLTAMLFRQFIAEISEIPARPIIVVIPNKEGMDSNFPLNSDEVASAGAFLVDGRAFLAKSDYFQKDGHWKPVGHKKAARELLEAIRIF